MSKPRPTKTAGAIEDAINCYDRYASNVHHHVFRDYYAEVFAAVRNRAVTEITSKNLNPDCVNFEFSSYTPVVLWVLIPGLSAYEPICKETVMTKICTWVDMPYPYYDAGSVFSSMVDRGRTQLLDALTTEPIPTYPVLRSWVEQKPCLKLLFPSLTFLPRRPGNLRWVYPIPELTDTLSILTMYQTMHKEPA